MKTKRESNGLRIVSGDSWRNLDKGKVASGKTLQPEEKRFKIAGYIRLSPSNEERDEGSLVSHPQRIKNFIEDKNKREPWGEIVDWYIDKDFSGKDTNRPNFQRMLSDIKMGKVNAVVVTEISRLTRQVKDFCELLEFLKLHKIAFFSLRENFDTSTPAGELMLMQSMAFAQFERHSIVDRIKKGARARAERGLGNGYVLLGFKLVEHKPNHREIYESERSYVEMIFNKFLEIKRINKLVSHLNENGFRTKEFVTKDGKKVGGNRWTVSTLHALLTNRAYIGQREFNKRNRTAIQQELKEEDRYFYVDAQWPALISIEIFEQVQNLLVQNKKKARKYIHQYRLTGLIHCDVCGKPMTGKSGTGKNGKYFYYGHSRKLLAKGDSHQHRCVIETVPAIQLEEMVIGRLKELANDRTLVEKLARNSTKESKDQRTQQKLLAVSLDTEYKKLNKKLNNLVDAIAEAEDKEVRLGLTKKMQEIQDQLEKIELSLLRTKREDEEGGNIVDVSSIFKFLKTIKSEFEQADISLQTQILKDVIHRIDVCVTGIKIKMYGVKPRIHLENPSENKPAVCRSGVRSVFGLVDPTRVELVTYPCHGHMIPTSPWARIVKSFIILLN